MTASHNQHADRYNSRPSLPSVCTPISSRVCIPPPSAIRRRQPRSICSVLQIDTERPCIGAPDDAFVHISPPQNLKRRFSDYLEVPERQFGQTLQKPDQPSQDPADRHSNTEQAMSNMSPQGRIIRHSPPLQPGEQRPGEACRLPSFNEVYDLDTAHTGKSLTVSSLCIP